MKHNFFAAIVCVLFVGVKAQAQTVKAGVVPNYSQYISMNQLMITNCNGSTASFNLNLDADTNQDVLVHGDGACWQGSLGQMHSYHIYLSNLDSSLEFHHEVGDYTYTCSYAPIIYASKFQSISNLPTYYWFPLSTSIGNLNLASDVAQISCYGVLPTGSPFNYIPFRKKYTNNFYLYGWIYAPYLSTGYYKITGYTKLPNYASGIYDTISCNSSYTFVNNVTLNNITHDTSYVATFTHPITGLDSLVITNLHVLGSSTTTNNASICAGNNFVFSDNSNAILTQDTIKYNYFTSVGGCDSLVIDFVIVNQGLNFTYSISLCTSQIPYSWHNQIITTSGTYTYPTMLTNGCAGVETVNITVQNPSALNATMSVCANQLPYVWNGQTITSSGIYTHPSTTASGCPNTDTLFLTVTSPTSNSTSITACNSYTWPINGLTYTQSGMYTYQSTNTSGCPHNDTLNLTILPIPQVSAPNVSSCLGPVSLGGSPAGGTWNLPNPYSGNASSYTYYYTAPNGCSQVATGNILSGIASVSNLQVGNNNGVSALIAWNGTAAWYEVRYKLAMASNWNATTTTNASNKLLTGLVPNTTYSVQVRGFCTGSTTSSQWVGISFTTNSNCGVPIGINVSNVTATTSKLNWSSVTGASYYKVRHRKVGNVTWITGTTSSNSKNLAALMPSTNYEFQVQTVCGNIPTAWSAAQNWTTGVLRTGDEVLNPISNSKFNIYPNPTRDEATIEFTAESKETVEIRIIDLSGRVMKQTQLNAVEGVNQFSISMGHLSKGIYLVQVVLLEHTYTSRVTKD